MAGVAVAGLVAGIGPVTGASTPQFIYPPMRKGMRGSHDGSFEVAHTLAWGGERPDEPKAYTDKQYDLVIMGAGISGLTSAWLARKKLGPTARILILDNHDDFGGHAKRNEFDVGGTRLVGYGGSQSISGPAKYSTESKEVFVGLGIEIEKFYKYFDYDFYHGQGMGEATHFSKKDYGTNHLLKPKTSGGLWWKTAEEKENLKVAIAKTPLSDESKNSLIRLFINREDWLAAAMPEASQAEKQNLLKKIS